MSGLTDFIDEATAPMSERTRENYRYTLKWWDRQCEERQVDPYAVTRFDLERLVGELKDAGYAARTIRSTLGHLRVMYRFLYEEGLLAADPGYLVRLPKTARYSTRPYLHRDEAKQWMHAAFNDDRPIALTVLLWLGSGLRPGEPAQIIDSDIGQHGEKTTVHLRQRKGGFGEVIAVPDPTAEKIEQFRGGPGTPLIRTQYGRSPARGGEAAWLRKFCRRHDLRYVTPYSLRISYITLAGEAGIDPRRTSGSVGHGVEMNSYYDRLHGAVGQNPASEIMDWVLSEPTDKDKR